jgi:O-methyltransferase involved in polyketide biosynthesis
LEPAEPTAWLAEGLLIYLSAAQAARLLAAVGQLSAPGSQLAFEHGTPAGARLLDQARASQAKSLRYGWVTISAAIRTACSAVQ